MKVNYGFERSQRNRTKELKKQEKLRRREEDAAKRKALKESEANGASAEGAQTAPPSSDIEQEI